MAETLVRTSPLANWAPRFAVLPATLQVTEEPCVTMIDLRSDAAGADTVAARIGFQLPTAASTYTVGGDIAAIWLGPDEWLITSTVDAGVTFETELRELVGPFGGTATDVSAQRTSLSLRGANARDVLEQGCSLDLHPRVFVPGTAAQTMVGQAGVVLMAVDGTGANYRILVRSSFAHYFAAWILDSATEFIEIEGQR
ncbi:sarcosine oxidase subunit gamma [Antrihabitans sp. NCIMB 15449]|uniref:Sarcosine oxidase subunit gamma n=1 Tax=Antrihabitans spumae TaxID=3373370 RepID=A0ABW7JMB3_9NOCA